MKKSLFIIAALLVLTMVLTACGVDKSLSDTNESSAGSSVKTEAETTEDEVEPTKVDEEDTEEVDETETSEETDEPDPEPEEEAKTEGPMLPVGMSDERGNAVDFSDYEGKLLLVNFFGTWCHYCMEEMPDFQKFTDNYGDQATIVLVNALETENVGIEGVHEWYDSEGYTMPMVIDVDRSKTEEFYGAIQGFPTTFVYDADQNFLGYVGGMMEYEMLEQIVADYGQ